MTRLDFEKELLRQAHFVDHFVKILKVSVRNEFSQTFEVSKGADEVPDWKYLLFVGSILALSDNEDSQDAALRIAQACLCRKDSDEQERAAAAVILSELSNEPGIGLAMKRNLLKTDVFSEIPTPFLLDRIRRGFKNSLVTGDSNLLFMNRFQSEVYKKSKAKSWLSLSAPTSAGKSFVLGYIVEEFLAKSSSGKVCFLVPTRALISQVEADLIRRITNSGQRDVYISSVPRLPVKWDTSKVVMVLTQERLKWLNDEAPADFSFDLLVVDEAQKIGDGHRGIILQQVLTKATEGKPNLRVIFSSPLSENPEIFLPSSQGSSEKVASDYVAVNQNLIFVEQVEGKPKVWQLSLCKKDDSIDLGNVTLEKTPGAGAGRLAAIAAAIGGESGILVYADIPSEAEKIADRLWKIMGADFDCGEDVRELIKTVKDSIHREYLLAKVLSRGVAFHYGNMPTAIRSEIERLFKEGKIRFLVCTATLIEGVNLGARSIFLRGPRKGRKLKMSEVDFWNLAGRAGRLGSDFQGNIVCVDVKKKDVWDFTPPKRRTRYKIKKASDISPSTVEKLTNYIREGTPRSTALKEPFLEYALTHFLFEIQQTGKITLPSVEDENQTLVDILVQELKDMESKTTIPKDILERNPGVSPLAMDNLLKYFKGYKKDLEKLIPEPPKHQDSAKNSYLPILHRIFKYLSGDHKKRAYPLAILVVSWTRGLPLAAIISSQVEYWSEHGKSTGAIIRNTMEDVEQFARYKFAKYSSCYLDLLRYHFQSIEKPELVSKIPNLHMWLEFGSSQETQISLMSLGFSRTAAIGVSKIFDDEELDREGCIKKLLLLEPEKIELSKPVLNEIRNIQALFALHTEIS